MRQCELKEIILYNSQSGEFTWLVTKGARAVKGSSAGSINKDGYIAIKISGAVYLAHRLAWIYVYGEWPEDQIDHINHNKKDNGISNLRVVSNLENHKNRTINNNNSSGVSGVFLIKRLGKWAASIRIDGEPSHLGVHSDWFEAVCRRKSAEVRCGYHANHGRKICPI